MSRLRRFTRMLFRQYPNKLWLALRSRVDWASEVGDGTSSSTVMAPVLWTARTFPEAPPALWKLRDDGQEEPVRQHDLLRLLQRPNPFHTGPLLWMATLVDWMVDGNAHWLKIRSRAGQPVQLWWAPHWTMEPKGNDNDNSVYIDHYEYSLGDSDPVKIDPRDVVHFRFGMDADNPRKGFSPLKSVLREVFTDDEAAAFTASLLRNMGVPGLVVSPDTDEPPSEGDVEAAKEYFKGAFSGDRRGEPLVLGGRTRVQQFGFSPEQLVLRDLRRIPEERVTAVLGIPAIVAGLGAGLDRSTFTNMAEAREAAYEAGIIPTQRILAEDIRFQLLTDFEPLDEVLDEWRFGFDLSKVRVLQEDLYRQAQRLDLAIRGGWAMVGEGRRAVGLDVDDERDRLFLRPLNIAEVPADGGSARVLAPARNGNSDGNGSSGAHEIAQEVVREIHRDALAAQ